MAQDMTFVKLSPNELRKHKGVSFTGISTLFFCHDGKGNLFLTKRSSKARDERGRWEFGGGGLKHGQAIESNMRRELLEEYNVVPIKTEFIGYFDVFRTSANAHSTHWLAMCFVVRVDPNKVKINEPEMVEAQGWFSLENLPHPMHSQFDLFMDKHGDKLKQVMQNQ